MKLNTKIKSIDLISSKDKIQFDNEGTFPINFGNNFIDENEQIKFQSEIELIEDRLSFSIDVNFRYQSNCGRCLTASHNEDRSSFSTTLNINKSSQTISIGSLPTTLPLKDFNTISLLSSSTSGTPVNISLANGSAATLNGTPGNYNLQSIQQTGLVTITFYVDENSVWGTLNQDWAKRNSRLGSNSRSIKVETMDPKEIYKFCGLTWDEKCLNFHKRDDLFTNTASNDQIRRSVQKYDDKKYINYKSMLKNYDKKYNWLNLK